MKHRCFEILCFVIIDNLHCFHRNHQCFLKESSMNHKFSKISTLKALMIISVFIEIMNVSSMLHHCRIVVSLMNRPVFLMTTLMNHQCYQFVLDWGWKKDWTWLRRPSQIFSFSLRNKIWKDTPVTANIFCRANFTHRRDPVSLTITPCNT